MPSDLTIRKLQGTTTPSVLTKEERIQLSHKKVQDRYPNVYDETVPDVSDLIGLPQFGEMVKNYAKGVSIATASMGPDLLGVGVDPLAFAGPAAGAVRRQLEGSGINVSQTASVINPATGEAFTGDTLRDAIGLDPESVAGLIGEMTGNWEAFAAKAPALASQVFGGMMRVDPNATLGMLVALGGRGAKTASRKAMVASKADAEKMLQQGEPAWKVYAQTGWNKGSDGNLKFFLSDKDSAVNVWRLRDAAQAKIDEGLLNVGDATTIRMTTGELLQHPALYDIYPEIAETPIFVSVKRTKDIDGRPQFIIYDERTPSVAGEFIDPRRGYPEGALRVRNVSIDDPEFGRKIILHEAQHKVQSIEGWQGGASGTRLKEAAENATYAREIITINDAISNGILTSRTTRKQLNDFIMSTGLISEGELATKGGKQALQRLRREIEGKIASADRLEDSLWVDEAAYSQALDELSNAFGNPELTDDIIKMMENDSVSEVLDKAMQRYFNDGGEVEARLAEFLRNRTEEEVRGLALVQEKTLEDFAERMPDHPVAKEDIIRTGEGGVAENYTDDMLKVQYPEGVKLNEEVDFFTKPSYIGSGEKQHIPVIKNPTATALRRWVDKHVPHRGNMDYDLRFVEDTEGNIYIWDAYRALHEDMAKAGMGQFAERGEDSIEAIMGWLPESISTDQAKAQGWISEWREAAQDMSRREAIQTLVDRNAIGARREAAQYVLTGEPFKTIDKERLFKMADEEGLL